MRILFVTSTRIGDAVLSTALLGHLLRAHPEARFTVACGPAAAGIFARMPRLERLILVPKRRYAMHWPRLWAQVAFTLWDLVVDMRGSALAWMVPARRRATYRGSSRPGHRLTHIAEVLRLDPPPLPVAWTTPEDEADAAALLPGGPWLMLAPTANWAGKVWPPEHFVTVARALTAPGGALADARIAVIAGPGATEAAMAAPVLAALPGALDLIGTLPLPETAAAFRRTALFIGNDSGLMHLSAACGTPTLGLFGPTDAVAYAPSGPRAALVRSDDSTMAGLPAARAIAAAEALLAAPAAA